MTRSESTELKPIGEESPSRSSGAAGGGKGGARAHSRTWRGPPPSAEKKEERPRIYTRTVNATCRPV